MVVNCGTMTMKKSWKHCMQRGENVFVVYSKYLIIRTGLVHLVCNDSSIQVKLHKRFLKIFICAYESENNVVSIIAKGVLEGSRSHACASLHKIFSLYNLDKYSLTNACLQNVLDIDTESDITTAAAVTDFFAYRRSHPDDSDVTEIIEFYVQLELFQKPTYCCMYLYDLYCYIMYISLVGDCD